VIQALKKVKYEEMFPHEIEEIMRETPVAYLPLGTLEWHGLHLALGNDAVKAYELCLRVASKAGGIVVPPTYWAIGGMPQPWTTRFTEELIGQLFCNIFEQLSQVGFKVIIAVTGHYGDGTDANAQAGSSKDYAEKQHNNFSNS